MSVIHAFPKWDKNRPIYFQLGLVIALSLANIVINFESTMPSYDYDTEDFYDTGELYQEVNMHTEKTSIPKPIVRTVEPLIAKIVTVNDPTTETEVIHPVIQTPSSLNVSNQVFVPISITQNFVPESQKAKDTKIWSVAENMPYLSDCNLYESEAERRVCTQNKLIHHIHKHLRYPSAARESTIEGTVVLTFVIDSDGNMKDINIAREIGGGCGQAAVAALKGLPTWIAGQQNQKAVNVKYTIPIKFKLD